MNFGIRFLAFNFKFNLVIFDIDFHECENSIKYYKIKFKIKG